MGSDRDTPSSYKYFLKLYRPLCGLKECTLVYKSQFTPQKNIEFQVSYSSCKG
jgi:hypothetical protein